jgi:hypothetical protein
VPQVSGGHPAEHTPLNRRGSCTLPQLLSFGWASRVSPALACSAVLDRAQQRYDALDWPDRHGSSLLLLLNKFLIIHNKFEQSAQPKRLGARFSATSEVRTDQWLWKG